MKGTLKETMTATVSEIHAYPGRPRGFAEPLFHSPQTRRTVMEHFLEAPWLRRASEILPGAPAGDSAGPAASFSASGAAHRCEEPVEVRRNGRARRIEVVRMAACRRRGGWRSRTIVRLLGRWREVGNWWETESGRAVDRVVFRVELAARGSSAGASADASAGAVVDLARNNDVSDENWRLVGLVD